MNAVRSMLSEKQVPKEFWSEATNKIVKTKGNRVTHKAK